MISEIVYFSLLLGCAFSLPNGAPMEACENMTPRHRQNTPSNLTSNPYQVSVTTSTNGEISVSVSGPAFRGILLQARTAQDRTPMGTWNLPAGGNFKLLDCSSRTSSALTHANREDKTNQVFSWNPPDGSSATNFTVYATIVQSFTTYWVRIPSNQFTASSSASIYLNPLVLCFWITLLVGILFS